MASSNQYLLSLTTLSLYFSVSLAFFPGYNTHFMGPGFPNKAHPLTGLCPEYYRFTCPQVDEIVISVLKEAIARNPRIAASLLRMHFHDCFVQVTSNQNCTNPKLNHINFESTLWIYVLQTKRRDQKDHIFFFLYLTCLLLFFCINGSI